MSSNAPGGSYTPPPPPPPTAPGGGGGGQLVYPSTPPKDPILILILNLLIGGVGYLIMGQKTKGIVAIVVWVLGWAACGIPSGIVAVLAAIDGYLQAQQLQQGKPVGEWTWFSDHR
ncbi:MAG TPA: hypothetical protein VFM36_11640 [Thermoanaerobaculia bacterium]|jgi:hypothetical protein|nr:hypothetical protein [Thermoanaerobaculia bacterium]